MDIIRTDDHRFNLTRKYYFSIMIIFLFPRPCEWKCDLFKGFETKQYNTTCITVLVIIIIIHYMVGIAIIVLLENLKTYRTQRTIERIISEARSFIYNAYGKLTNRVKVFSVPEL